MKQPNRLPGFVTVISANFLIVGLGNPGIRYRQTRHNIGFMAADHLARELGTGFTKKQARARLAFGVWEMYKILIAKPQTLMNCSGLSVAGLVRYHQIPLENLLIVYDDVHLPFGRLRLRKKGSAGGHNGLMSIIDELETCAFPRLRIGISSPENSAEMIDYVLGPFAKSEKTHLQKALQSSVSAIKMFMTEGIDKSMNYFNASA